MKQPRAVIVGTDDLWEGIYLDGKLVDEGHHLGEGNNKLYTLAFAEKHGLTFKDFTTGYIEGEFDGMPKELDDRFEIHEQEEVDYIL